MIMPELLAHRGGKTVDAAKIHRRWQAVLLGHGLEQCAGPGREIVDLSSVCSVGTHPLPKPKQVAATPLDQDR